MLCEAAVLLETAVEASSAASQLRLALVRVYCLLGKGGTGRVGRVYRLDGTPTATLALTLVDVGIRRGEPHRTPLASPGGEADAAGFHGVRCLRQGLATAL
jgi:hypothetical protein